MKGFNLQSLSTGSGTGVSEGSRIRNVSERPFSSLVVFPFRLHFVTRVWSITGECPRLLQICHRVYDRYLTVRTFYTGNQDNSPWHLRCTFVVIFIYLFVPNGLSYSTEDDLRFVTSYLGQSSGYWEDASRLFKSGVLFYYWVLHRTSVGLPSGKTTDFKDRRCIRHRWPSGEGRCQVTFAGRFYFSDSSTLLCFRSNGPFSDYTDGRRVGCT